MTWLVYLLFAVAGLLVGGAWSAYQAENRAMTYIAAVGLALPGDELYGLRVIAMRQRDARVSRRADGRSDAGNDFERDACLGQYL